MKLLLTIYLFFFLTGTSVAQDTLLNRVCYITPSMDPWSRSFFITDVSNQTFTEYEEIWYNNTWNGYAQSVYQWNQSNDTIAILHYTPDSGVWQLSSGIFYEFDSLHRKTSASSYYQILNDTTSKYTYQYDSLDRLTTINYYHKNNGVMTLEYVTQNFYNSFNKIDSALTTAIDTAAGYNNYYHRIFYTSIQHNDSIDYTLNLNPGMTIADTTERRFVLYDYINNADTTFDQYYYDWSGWDDCYIDFYYQVHDSLNRIIHSYSTCCICGYSDQYTTYNNTSDSILNLSWCDFSHGGVGGCYTCDYLYQRIISGIRDLSEPKIDFFPNPAIRSLQINSSKKMERILLYDMMGKIVFSQDNADFTTTVTLPALASGVYSILFLFPDGDGINKKLMIQN